MSGTPLISAMEKFLSGVSSAASITAEKRNEASGFG